MTPEPIALAFCVVTATSTTAALTFAIATSCAVATVDVACTVLVGWAVLVLVLLNCQPANRPTPKITASSSVSATSAPVRTVPLRFGLTGGKGGGTVTANGAPGSAIPHVCCCSVICPSASFFIF